MITKKDWHGRLSRPISMILAVAMTICFSFGFLVFESSAASLSGYTISPFYVEPKVSFRTYTSSLPSSGFLGYRSSYSSTGIKTYGVVITLPSNASAVSVSLYGIFPASSNSIINTSSDSWLTLSSDFSNSPVHYILSTSSSIPPVSTGRVNTNQDFITSYEPGSPIYVPAHSGYPLYLFVFGSIRDSNEYAYGISCSSPRISVESSPWISLMASLNSISSKIDGLSGSLSGETPMDKFESDYLQNFQSQIQGSEKYLGNGSPVLPNNFVSGSNGQPSVVDSITENIGLSSGALNMTDFANASSSFSGSDSTGEGGMWQFFTQEVADDMATVSGAMFMSDFDIPSDFESELSKWIEDSERRYEKWCNP